MIELGSEYTTIEPDTGFQKTEAGGYILKCNKAESKTSKNGNPMFVLSFDIAKGRFKGNHDTYPLMVHQVILPSMLPRIKGMLQSFQKSNPSTISESVINSANFNELLLVGKFVGAVLRDEEYMNDQGEKKVSIKIQYLTSTRRITDGDFTVPDIKLLSATASKVPAPQMSEPADDSIPF